MKQTGFIFSLLFFYVVPSREETPFSTNFYGLHFSHLYTLHVMITPLFIQKKNNFSLIGIWPQSLHGTEYEVDGLPMCHHASYFHYFFHFWMAIQYFCYQALEQEADNRATQFRTLVNNEKGSDSKDKLIPYRIVQLEKRWQA